MSEKGRGGITSPQAPTTRVSEMRGYAPVPPNSPSSCPGSAAPSVQILWGAGQTLQRFRSVVPSEVGGLRQWLNST